MNSHPLRYTVAVLTAITFCIGIARPRAQSGCPGLNPNGPGWAAGAKVEYDLSGLPSGVVTNAALEAMSRWNSANQNNTSRVEFVSSGNGNGRGTVTLQAGDYTLNGPNGPTLAGINYGSRDEDTNALTQASILVDLDFTINGPNGPVSAYDSNQADDYFEALVGLFMHELGHSMGLADVPPPNGNASSCNGYTSNGSVMNGYCGTNDKGFGSGQGSQASNTTQCDNQAVSNAYSEWLDEGDDEFIDNGQGEGEETCYNVWHVTYYWYDNGNGPVYVYKTYDWIIDTWCDGGEPY